MALFGKFGEVIPGLEIYGKPAPYPVINEREVRAGAGILMMVAIIGFTHDNLIIHNFDWLRHITPFFFIDFLMRLTLGPSKSPLGALAKFLMRNHEPEWTGAVQKKFAWSIGLVMAATMAYISNFGHNGLVPTILCLMCISFSWLETAFGWCAGCKIYGGLLKLGVIPAPEYKPVCPGNACEIKF